jgi:hypothetical protein
VRAALCLGGLCVAAAAWAAPSGLTTIPTADVVPAGQWLFQLQNGDTDLRGPASLFVHPEPAYLAQSGFLAARVECGADLVPQGSPGDYALVLNAKALLVEEGYALPAVAAGVAQVSPGLDPLYYAVASRTLNYGRMQYQKFRAHHRNLKLHGVRLHAGAVGAADDPRALAGTDVELSEHFVVQADWISGGDRAASLGGTWILDQQTSVQAAILRGNGSGRIDGLQLGYTHQFTW